MTDTRFARHADSLRPVTIEFTPLRKWPADRAIIMPSDASYQVDGSDSMAGTLCAVCLDPLGIAPFSVHVMVYPGPCDRANTHMPSSAIAIHVACEIPQAPELCELIIALTVDCAP